MSIQYDCPKGHFCPSGSSHPYPCTFGILTCPNEQTANSNPYSGKWWWFIIIMHDKSNKNYQTKWTIFTRCIDSNTIFHYSHINIFIEFGLLLALFTIIIFSFSKFTAYIINEINHQWDTAGHHHHTIPMKKEEISSAINDDTISTTNYNNADDNFNNKDNHEDYHNDIVSIDGISDRKRSSKNRSDIEKTHLVHDFKHDTLEHNQHMNFKAYTSFKVILTSSSSS